MRSLRMARASAVLAAALCGSVAATSCRARVLDALDQAVIDYVYSLIDPNNLADLFEIPGDDS